ncbi:MAG: sigma 54-interacting transcriptional regulator, partial [Zoogloea sp.]|nr:sigma 54-interacting transcriptional regulator [Zoogloea sp.]
MCNSGPCKAPLALTTIHEIGKTMAELSNTDAAFRRAMNVLCIHLGIARSMLLVEDAGGRLVPRAAVGLSREQLALASYARSEGVIGQVFASGIPAVIEDVQQDDTFLDRTGAFGRAEGGRPASFVAVPVKAGRQVVGVLACSRPSPEAQGRIDDELRMLGVIATLFAHRLTPAAAPATNAGLHDKAVRLFSLMRNIGEQLRLAASSQSNVLVCGKQGTGKELLARAIHALSSRAGRPFLRVACATLDEDALDGSGGHGLFAAANGGTLFLDEVGDLALPLQAGLLHKLQAY